MSVEEMYEFIEALEAIAAVSHHLAGLRHAAELLGQLQQADLGFDDLLFCSQFCTAGCKVHSPSARSPHNRQ
jgi:hypothetical protein